MSASGEDLGRPSLREPLVPVAVIVALAAAMWASEIIDLLPGVNLDRWGIRPRRLSGLLRIPLAPFLHSGFGHLFANTIPFLVLGIAIAIGDVGRFVRVTLIVGLVSGLGVWLLAPANSITLGASGLVFGYLTYLVARGVFARNVLWLVGGVVVMIFYGGILWGLLPRPGISWSGHAFGAVGGILAGYLLHGARDDDPATAGVLP